MIGNFLSMDFVPRTILTLGFLLSLNKNFNMATQIEIKYSLEYSKTQNELEVSLNEIQDMYCKFPIDYKKQDSFLYCPLTPGFCFINCESFIDQFSKINCTTAVYQNKFIVHHYRFRIRDHHAGKWKCHLDTLESSPIDIILRDEIVITSLEHRPATLVDGDSVSISCSAAIPRSKIITMVLSFINFDGKETTVDSNEDQSRIEGKIKSVNHTRLKTLKCCATSSNNKRKCDLKSVLFDYKPEIIGDLKKKVTVSTHEDSVKLVVNYKVSPMTHKIQWYFMADHRRSYRDWTSKQDPETAVTMRPIHSDGSTKYSIFESHQSTAALQIDELKESDFGLYVCSISNNIGDTRSRFWLVSEDAVIIPDDSIKAVKQLSSLSIIFRPPKLGQYSHVNLLMCTGRRLTKCKKQNIPKPEMGIFKYPAEFDEDENIEMELKVYRDQDLIYSTKPFTIEELTRTGIFTLTTVQLSIIIPGVIGVFILISLVLMCIYCKFRRIRKNYIDSMQSKGTYSMSHGKGKMSTTSSDSYRYPFKMSSRMFHDPYRKKMDSIRSVSIDPYNAKMGSRRSLKIDPYKTKFGTRRSQMTDLNTMDSRRSHLKLPLPVAKESRSSRMNVPHTKDEYSCSLLSDSDRQQPYINYKQLRMSRIQSSGSLEASYQSIHNEEYQDSQYSEFLSQYTKLFPLNPDYIREDNEDIE